MNYGYISKGCKLDNSESFNFLKLSFRNIEDLRANFVHYYSFLESNFLTFLLYVRPGWLNWFWQFLCEELSSFNPKGFYYSYAWSRSLCKGRTSFYTWLSYYVSSDTYLCFRLGLLQSVPHFFFHHRSISSLCTASDSISSNIDQVLSIDPFANMFVIGDFNVHHKDRLTQTDYLKRPYSDG